MSNDTTSNTPWGHSLQQDPSKVWSGAPPPPPAAPPPAPPANPWPTAPAPTWHPQSAPGHARSTNGLAIAALVLGIVWIWWIGSILAVIFGHVALSQIDRSHGTQGGRGLAIAGLVLGWIGVGTLALVVIAAVASSGSSV
jgi:hypothetical protein